MPVFLTRSLGGWMKWLVENYLTLSQQCYVASSFLSKLLTRADVVTGSMKLFSQLTRWWEDYVAKTWTYSTLAFLGSIYFTRTGYLHGVFPWANNWKVGWGASKKELPFLKVGNDLRNELRFVCVCVFFWFLPAAVTIFFFSYSTRNLMV